MIKQEQKVLSSKNLVEINVTADSLREHRLQRRETVMTERSISIQMKWGGGGGALI